MAEQEQNRTEPATPFKLQEAKKRGQVAKSLELMSFLMIMSLLAVITIWGREMVAKQLHLDRLLFEHAADLSFSVTQVSGWLKAVALQSLMALAPLFVVLIVVGILANLVQTGPIFSFFPLKPDFQRLNPVAGFKRLFSMRLLFESVKSVVKLVFFGAILYFMLIAFMPKMLALMHINPDGYPLLLLDYLAELIFKLAMAILLVVVIDFAYTRWDYAKKMKMSQREVKEEVKRREGDPQVRARIRELQREALKRSKALTRVPDADVLITNPNHLALAVLYTRGTMDAPQIIAKGAGELALKMKAVARSHRIPIVENRLLARKLFKTATIDAPIPESAYAAVARLLAWVYTLKSGSYGVSRS